MSTTKQVQLKLRRVREITEETTVVVEMPDDMPLADIGMHYNTNLPAGTVTLPPDTSWQRVNNALRHAEVIEIVNLSAGQL